MAVLRWLLQRQVNTPMSNISHFLKNNPKHNTKPKPHPNTYKFRVLTWFTSSRKAVLSLTFWSTTEKGCWSQPQVSPLQTPRCIPRCFIPTDFGSGSVCLSLLTRHSFSVQQRPTLHFALVLLNISVYPHEKYQQENDKCYILLSFSNYTSLWQASSVTPDTYVHICKNQSANPA